MKIKVAELFYSIQGEGRYMGVPSIFLRTFGCNFTCGGFGMPSGCKSTQPDFIDPAAYRTYEELPLVNTGCDSFASWHPNFKHLSPMRDVAELAGAIQALLPPPGWLDTHLVITGGEPLLGWQRAYPSLLDQPEMSDLRELTFETNGTQALTPELEQYLNQWQTREREVTFSVSPKLSCSGEPREVAIQPQTVLQYQAAGFTYLKYVIATQADAEEAQAATREYRAAGFQGPVYYMPVGGVEQVYHLNNRAVAELAMAHGVRYSDRLQVPLFKNEWGT